MTRIECPDCGATAMIGRTDEAAANDDERWCDWEAPEGFRKVQCGPRSERVYLYCATCGVPAHVARPRFQSDALSANEGEQR